MNLINALFKDKDVVRPLVDNLTQEVITTIEKTVDNTVVEAQAKQLRGKLRDASMNKMALENILPDAYTSVVIACRQLKGSTFSVMGKTMTWNMVPYPKQIMCGVALHLSTVAEMETGEGKTLAAVMPAFPNSLTGKPVIILTANEYLAQRDSEWMQPLYCKLGLKAACVLISQSQDQKRQASVSDVIYTTATEFGFDYLRDNSISMSMQHKVIQT